MIQRSSRRVPRPSLPLVGTDDETPMAFSDKDLLPWWRRALRLVADAVACPFKLLPTLIIASIPGLLLWRGLNGGSSDGVATEEERCRLLQRFSDGSFLVGSHRSFVDSTVATQPSCADALDDLVNLGVRYLDLDLVYGVKDKTSTVEQLLVAHPMEYSRTSSYYSPCSLTPLSELLDLLDSHYWKEGEAQNKQNREWFVTLEPKASWDGKATEQKEGALAAPLDLLRAVLEVAEAHDLEPRQCGLILDSNKIHDPEEIRIVKELQSHCSLVFPIRRDDLPLAKNGLTLFDFEYEHLLPTIEFHPDHGNYPGVGVGDDSASITLESLRNIVPSVIFWVVDTPGELRMAASLKPRAVVSNRPKEIIKVLNEEEWCSSRSEVVGQN